MCFSCTSLVLSFLSFCLGAWVLEQIFIHPALYHVFSLSQLTFGVVLVYFQMLFPLTWNYPFSQSLECALEQHLSVPLFLGMNGYALLSYVWLAGFLRALHQWKALEDLAWDYTCKACSEQKYVDLHDWMPDQTGEEAQVCISTLTASPVVITQTRTILLPDIQFTSRQMTWILRHEFRHLQNQDGLYMQAFNLLKAVYWFLPFAAIGRSVLVLFTESRVDRHVTHACTMARILDYCETLLFVARRQCSTPSVPALGFLIRDEDMLKIRIRLLMASGHPAPAVWKRMVQKSLGIFLSICLLVFL